MKYKYIIVGGTFDHLHIGHKGFLRYAFNISEKVLIGITSDSYISKNKENIGIEKLEVRERNLKHFLKSEDFLENAKFVILNHVFEDEVFDIKFDGVLVTQETLTGAKKINKERERKGLSALEIIIVNDFLKNDLKITATRIRNGEIDKNGEMFLKEKWKQKTLFLPGKLKPLFQSPLGEVIHVNTFDFTKIDFNKTITVGDETAKIFNDKKLNSKISVVDFKINRKKIFSKTSELGFLKNEKIWEAENYPSEINKKIWDILEELKLNILKNKRMILIINGEEDLIVLPLIILFPLGFFIFYGQPNEGMVFLKINLHLKRKVVMLLNKLRANY